LLKIHFSSKDFGFVLSYFFFPAKPFQSQNFSLLDNLVIGIKIGNLLRKTAGKSNPLNRGKIKKLFTPILGIAI